MASGGGGHQTEERRNGLLRCVNCEGNHWTGHCSCRKQMEEQEILDMQLKDKISRGMARQQYHARYSERGESYARKVTEARTGREVVTDEGRCVDSSDRITEEVDQEQMEDRAATAKRVREEECEGDSSGIDEDNQTSENNKTSPKNV